MKKKSFLFVVSLAFLIACNKKDAVSANDTYSTTTAGSIWVYQLADTTNGNATDTLVTLTATNDDTLINGKTYHVLIQSLSPVKEYDAVDADNYYTLGDHVAFPVPGIDAKPGFREIIYLKSDLPVGGTYLIYDTAYTFNDLQPEQRIAIPIVTTYTILEKDITRMVNNISYTGVIHVFSSSSSAFFAPQAFVNTSDCYYAKKSGLIESDNKYHINYTFSFDQHFHTTLINSYIK